VWILLGFSLLFVVLSIGFVSGIGVSWKPSNAPSIGRNCDEDGKGQWFQKVKRFLFIYLFLFIYFFVSMMWHLLMWRLYGALDVDVDIDMSNKTHVADGKMTNRHIGNLY
jgi:hypothetical protein